MPAVICTNNMCVYNEWAAGHDLKEDENDE